MSGFLKWLAGLNPFAQIPLVIGAFLLVAGILIFFIEIAPRTGRRYTIIRALVCVFAPVTVFLLLGSIMLAAVVAAILGGVFFLLDYRARAGAGYLFQLIGFLSPALFLLTIGLVYPTVATFFKAFMNARGNRFVGFENFVFVFGQEANRVAIINTIIWVLVVPAFSTAVGLAYAVFVDKARGEKILKALVFMPMAISLIGAGVIWKFVYAFNDINSRQIGLLNAIWVALGGQPQAWIAQLQPWNNLFLILILIWLQTGYAMVLFSAAIKGIPAELLEAARIDGAHELVVFFKIVIPQIMGTIIAVSTTVVIFTLKIFDIVLVMTGGQYGTDVIAIQFYNQYFTNRNFGLGSSIAVVLLIAVIPVMIYNLKQFRERESF